MKTIFLLGTFWVTFGVFIYCVLDWCGIRGFLGHYYFVYCFYGIIEIGKELSYDAICCVCKNFSLSVLMAAGLTSYGFYYQFCFFQGFEGKIRAIDRHLNGKRSQKILQVFYYNTEAKDTCALIFWFIAVNAFVFVISETNSSPNYITYSLFSLLGMSNPISLLLSVSSEKSTKNPFILSYFPIVFTILTTYSVYNYYK